jgi:hypothetical protein
MVGGTPCSGLVIGGKPTMRYEYRRNWKVAAPEESTVRLTGTGAERAAADR